MYHTRYNQKIEQAPKTHCLPWNGILCCIKRNYVDSVTAQYSSIVISFEICRICLSSAILFAIEVNTSHPVIGSRFMSTPDDSNPLTLYCDHFDRGSSQLVWTGLLNRVWLHTSMANNCDVLVHVTQHWHIDFLLTSCSNDLLHALFILDCYPLFTIRYMFRRKCVTSSECLHNWNQWSHIRIMYTAPTTDYSTHVTMCTCTCSETKIAQTKRCIHELDVYVFLLITCTKTSLFMVLPWNWCNVSILYFDSTLKFKVEMLSLLLTTFGEKKIATIHVVIYFESVLCLKKIILNFTSGLKSLPNKEMKLKSGL